jgi:predicted amidophosphoribosyltransferase
MCGCMSMHATMNDEGHQSPAHQSGMRPVTPTVSTRPCAHCSFPLEAGYAFCPNCGMSLQTAKCPACGQKIEPSWSNCAYCGSPLGETQPSSAHR